MDEVLRCFRELDRWNPSGRYSVSVPWDAAADAELAGLATLRRLGLHPDQITVDDTYNRWRVVPFATVNHLCIGSIFAWSMFNPPLMQDLGVVAPSSSDWALGEISLTFSLVMGGFAWGAVFGKYLDGWGPRASCLIGAASLGGGYSLAAAGIHMHR